MKVFHFKIYLMLILYVGGMKAVCMYQIFKLLGLSIIANVKVFCKENARRRQNFNKIASFQTDDPRT